MGKGKPRIKPRAPSHGDRIKPPTAPIDYDKRPPIFSLERIQDGDYCLSKLDQEHKAAFADAIYRRRNVLWKDLKQIDRHGLGTEKIPRRKIKASIPPFITEDVADFLVFRYRGKSPMVGYRVKDIFYVLWFDSNYKLYDHGA